MAVGLRIFEHVVFQFFLPAQQLGPLFLDVLHLLLPRLLHLPQLLLILQEDVDFGLPRLVPIAFFGNVDAAHGWLLSLLLVVFDAHISDVLRGRFLRQTRGNSLLLGCLWLAGEGRPRAHVLLALVVRLALAQAVGRRIRIACVRSHAQLARARLNKFLLY